jgi:hypothetical protein
MGSDEAFTFTGPPCSCDEAMALRRRLAETQALLEAAAGELDKRDEHMAELRRLLLGRLKVAHSSCKGSDNSGEHWPDCWVPLARALLSPIIRNERTTMENAPTAPPPVTPAPAGPGRIVHYRLTEDDAMKINRRRTTGGAIASRIAEGSWPPGAQAHIGNAVNAGDYYPMMVTRCQDGSTLVNGQVFLDGSDVYWATSVHQGDGNGDWCWPPRAPQ